MADGGYTPSEIDRFTLADATLFFRFPSVRAMVAGYLGVKPQGVAPAGPVVTSAAALRAQFPDGIMRG